MECKIPKVYKRRIPRVYKCRKSMAYERAEWVEQLLVWLPLTTILSFVAYFGGLVIMLGFLLFFPMLILITVISLHGLYKSIKKRTFYMHTLFAIPIIFSAYVGLIKGNEIEKERLRENRTLSDEEIEELRELEQKESEEESSP